MFVLRLSVALLKSILLDDGVCGGWYAVIVLRLSVALLELLLMLRGDGY